MANPNLTNAMNARALGVDDFEAVLRLIQVSEFNPEALYTAVEYKGFSRKAFLTHVASLGITPKGLAFASLVGAVRGNNFKKMADINWQQYTGDARFTRKFALSKAAIGRRPINTPTFSRCSSAAPEFAAAILHQARAPARIAHSQCPACLQFPGAASLPLNPATRILHKAFSKEFSAMLPSKRTVDQDQVYDSIASKEIPIGELNTSCRIILADYLVTITEDASTARTNSDTTRLNAIAARLGPQWMQQAEADHQEEAEEEGEEEEASGAEYSDEEGR